MYFDPNAMAIRLLSSILKRDFPEDVVSVVLLSHKFKPPRMDFGIETPEDLAAIKDFFAQQQFDLIGLSLMTNYLERAVQLSQAIREVSAAKILWGGIHPTLRPEECIQHADIVFVGEAESSLPELVRRLKNHQSINELPGVWSREDDRVMGEKVCPACIDLDSLPSPDFDFESQYVYSPEVRRVIPMKEENLIKSSLAFYGGNPFYRIMTARGCSQACEYCINAKYQKLLGLEKRIRKRSIDSVLNELEKVKSMSAFKSIVIIDDDICLRSVKWLKAFSEIYREKVGLPFICQATAGRVTAEKIGCLRDAGAMVISIGVQTGSDRLNYEVFNRKISRKHVLRAADIIHREAPKIKRAYDFLVRIPYETLQDKIETAKILLELPLPYIVSIYALTLFPGLALTDRVKRDGIMMSNNAGSIYDYDGSPEDCDWKKLLENSYKIPADERNKLLAHMDNNPPSSTNELISLFRYAGA
jgi:anaerobic magnesium-protoporphyrin IX monomethyl ester cyclase